MEIMVRAFDHPDVARLVAEVQQEYVVRYGGPDATPTDPAQFAPPKGLFLVAYLDGVPAACGGWRAHDADEPGFRDGDAEIKRMYVTPGARGRGLARHVLAELERTAREAGRTRMVLETGERQPEAIALYLSSGYMEVDAFGLYACAPGSRYFGRALPA